MGARILSWYFLRLAEEYGVNVPKEGILVPFDIPTLIHKIYIGPLLSSLEIEKVREVASSVGISEHIFFSSLLGKPR